MISFQVSDVIMLGVLWLFSLFVVSVATGSKMYDRGVRDMSKPPGWQVARVGGEEPGEVELHVRLEKNDGYSVQVTTHRVATALVSDPEALATAEAIAQDIADEYNARQVLAA